MDRIRSMASPSSVIVPYDQGATALRMYGTSLMVETQHAIRDGHASNSSASLRRAAIAAFIWAFLFGLVSIYWAAGGTFGVNTLSRSIQELAERGDPAFVATVWITGIAKVLAGLIPLALAFGWWRRIPRRLLSILCWVGGALLMLYGLGDMIRAVLHRSP